MQIKIKYYPFLTHLAEEVLNLIIYKQVSIIPEFYYSQVMLLCWKFLMAWNMTPWYIVKEWNQSWELVNANSYQFHQERLKPESLEPY